ncbi:DUF4190 domain-containing protein [Nocardioides marmorisolisilvae]|uniref:DUF4190 domain-containing protein n=1 Tax=Nocardioides marmorisolisilvae TaxID=1542737 RepID=A0A3N0DVV2_9ACTN|nr:DUF4190 domain-containing protein [Nocardioides marmorisolisilvae]RNL79750.1 DUF4190 domain-containing protein [Nocardioides marmorisolisilvae]
MSELPPEQPQQPPYAQAPPPPPAPGYTQQAYGPYTPEPPATNRATLALVLGIVGLTVCPGAASIPAWIIGNEAVKEIDASQGQLGGRSMAFAGKVTGIIGTVLAGAGLLAIGAIFLISALVVDSVGDCEATGDDTSFSVHC